MVHIHESAIQLSGWGSARQIPGNPRVGVASNGDGLIAAAMLLMRD
jgi:hypothetical protein